MIKAHLKGVRNILCLGAHPDDIEIGCGGTVLKLLSEIGEVSVHWVVLSAGAQRGHEAVESAGQFLKKAQQKTIIVKDFRDTYFPFSGEKIKDYFYQLQRELSPDLIFTHRLEDRHQDHRLIAELTWNTFRDHLIFEYEIPKYEGDLHKTNFYVGLERSVCQFKVRTLIDTFISQKPKSWFTEDLFWALMRIRGVESKSPSGFAEGLYCRKMVM